jgi:hypothetical protein
MQSISGITILTSRLHCITCPACASRACPFRTSCAMASLSVSGVLRPSRKRPRGKSALPDSCEQQVGSPIRSGVHQSLRRGGGRRSGGQPERLPGEKLPAAVLLSPHLQHAYARRAGFSIRLGLSGEDVSCDGIVTDHGNARIR